jgi:hypothetical protein
MFVIKVLITAVMVAAASEIAKRSNWLAAVILSLPLTSVLAFIWIYVDSRDAKKISELSLSTLWMVIPSLAFFICLPVCIKLGVNFWLSFLISVIVTAVVYFAFSKIVINL